MSGKRRPKEYDLRRMRKIKPPPVPWAAEPIAAAGEVTILFGPAGIGKSLLCLAMAHCVGRGRDLAGLKCKQGHAVYLDAENGEYEVHRRVRALSDSPKGLSIYDAGGLHLVEDIETIGHVVEEKGASLLVLDSMRALLPGSEENDSGEMAEALASCKVLAQQQDVAVVIIHHTKKDGETYRGSGAIKDQCSIMFEFNRVNGDIARDRRVLVNQKMRIAPEPPDYHLLLGFEDSRLIAEQAFPPAEGDLVRGDAQREFVRQILTLLEDGPRSRPELARLLGREKKDGTVRRAVEKLEKQGRIEQDNRHKWHLSG